MVCTLKVVVFIKNLECYLGTLSLFPHFGQISIGLLFLQPHAPHLQDKDPMSYHS